jgi:glutathione S-transferase
MEHILAIDPDSMTTWMNVSTPHIRLYIPPLLASLPPQEQRITRAGTQKRHQSFTTYNRIAVAEMAGQSEDLKLLGMFASPFALRVKLALSFKGLSYEYLEEKDLHNNKSELLLKSNPVHKKVPVLIHNGKPVCESMIIVQYVDEAFASVGPSLLPSDPHERAVARFWAAYIDEKVRTVYNNVKPIILGENFVIILMCVIVRVQLFSSWMMVFKGKTDEEKAEGTKQSFAVAATLEGALRECSKGKPFFGGDSVGYVDVALGGFVAWVHAVEKLYGLKVFDAAKTPLLAAWLERFGALDAAKAVMPDAEKLVELAKMRQAQAAAAAGAGAAQDS